MLTVNELFCEYRDDIGDDLLELGVLECDWCNGDSLEEAYATSGNEVICKDCMISEGLTVLTEEIARELETDIDEGDIEELVEQYPNKFKWEMCDFDDYAMINEYYKLRDEIAFRKGIEE